MEERSEETLKTEAHDQAVPEAYAAFMRTGWRDGDADVPRHPVAPYAAARRARLAETFPGERLVLPAGTFKVRAAAVWQSQVHKSWPVQIGRTKSWPMA